MKLARVATMSFSIVSQLRKQLEAIKNQNIDITIISGRDDGMEFINKLDIPHKDIKIPRDISLIKDFLALINLYLCFRREDFDIVHSTTPKAGLLASIAGFSLVYRLESTHLLVKHGQICLGLNDGSA